MKSSFPNKMHSDLRLHVAGSMTRAGLSVFLRPNDRATQRPCSPGAATLTEHWVTSSMCVGIWKGCLRPCKFASLPRAVLSPKRPSTHLSDGVTYFGELGNDPRERTFQNPT